MVNWLIHRFVKDYENVKNPDVRSAYGKFSGIVGIIANILLFFGKFLAGVLSGALSIIADAFNNLSDAASSVVTLLGFKLAEAPPDDEHPFGHGRIEYLSGMILGIIIMFAGWELGRSSFTKIIHPEATDFSVLSIAILVFAILIKLWLSIFFKKVGTSIESDTVLAASADSRNDIICTGLVLISSLVELLTGLQVDGFIGLAVAIFVLWTGISVVRQSISPLLGQAPDPELVKEIHDTVLSYEGVIGVHDLMVHNYGPGRVIISLHAEVPADVDIMISHDVMDQIEMGLMAKFKAVSCVHMDPVDTKNPEVNHLREMTTKVVEEIDEKLSLHDFRVVFGETHTNLIFDLVVPFGYENEDKLHDIIQQKIQEQNKKLFVVVQVEHQYY